MEASDDTESSVLALDPEYQRAINAAKEEEQERSDNADRQSFDIAERARNDEISDQEANREISDTGSGHVYDTQAKQLRTRGSQQYLKRGSRGNAVKDTRRF